MSNIIRVKKDTNYVVMNKLALQNKSLSWKAKGIMAYMLSMPDDWTFYMSELMTHSTDGEASFRAGFKELREQGFVKRFPIREGNKIVRWETLVLENPLLPDFQQVENLHVGNLDVENQRLLSNDSLLSNEELSKDIKHIESQFEELWKMYPNKKSKDRARKSFVSSIKKGADFEVVKQGLLNYIAYCNENDWYKPAHGSTWFNNKRWEDEYGKGANDGVNRNGNQQITEYEDGLNF